MQILLSRTQAGPGRTVKQDQDEISQNHVQRLNLISVSNLISSLINQKEVRFGALGSLSHHFCEVQRIAELLSVKRRALPRRHVLSSFLNLIKNADFLWSVCILCVKARISHCICCLVFQHHTDKMIDARAMKSYTVFVCCSSKTSTSDASFVVLGATASL